MTSGATISQKFWVAWICLLFQFFFQDYAGDVHLRRVFLGVIELIFCHPFLTPFFLI